MNHNLLPIKFLARTGDEVAFVMKCSCGMMRPGTVPYSMAVKKGCKIQDLETEARANVELMFHQHLADASSYVKYLKR